MLFGMVAEYSSFALSMTLSMKTLSLSQQSIQRYYQSVVSDEDVAKVHMLLKLLFIRSEVYHLDNFSVSDVKIIIDSLCTIKCFDCMLIGCTFLLFSFFFIYFLFCFAHFCTVCMM